MSNGLIRVDIDSFGYDHGPLADPATITLDLRGQILDTHQIPATEPRTGLDPDIAESVLESAGARRWIANTVRTVLHLLEDEADARLWKVTVAVGCATGIHQSPAVAEEIGHQLHEAGCVNEVWHRELRLPPTD
jgi:UPF0042 nucleotide-binding protein